MFTTIFRAYDRYGVPKRTKLFFARADLIFLNFARADYIHFISRARMPVHGKIVSTSFYNTTIPMTICSVATFITKSQSKSELQNFKFLKMEKRGIRPWRKVAGNFSQRAANTVEKLSLVKEMVLHGETAKDLSKLYGIWRKALNRWSKAYKNRGILHGNSGRPT